MSPGPDRSPSSTEPTLRDYRDGDQHDIVALITAVYGEYGDICEPDGFDNDLLTIPETLLAKGGHFAVLERDGRVVGCVGVRDCGDGLAELKRCYLARELRGRGLGSKLLTHALDWARGRGFTRMELWSDVRFAEGHRLYTRHGFEQGEQTRTLADINQSVEAYFRREL